jgi:hypothetical protein
VKNCFWNVENDSAWLELELFADGLGRFENENLAQKSFILFVVFLNNKKVEERIERCGDMNKTSARKFGYMHFA